MVDNSGPGRTTGLSDLGDTEGFDDPGTEGSVYGFELSGGSVQEEIIQTPESVTFSQLVGVKGTAQDYEHKLFWNSTGKWEVLPIIYWTLDIATHPQRLLTGKRHGVNKIMSGGISLVSFTPNHEDLLWVVRDNNGFYWLGEKSSMVRLDIVMSFHRTSLF